MTTNILPHGPLNPDCPVEVVVEFDSTEECRSREVESCVELYAQFVVGGGLFESCPGLSWRGSILDSRIHLTYDLLPRDPSGLAVLTRMFLALPRPPVAIQVRGTASGPDDCGLPSSSTALAHYPRLRPQRAYRYQLAPGAKWLCVEVSREAGLDLAAAELIDQRCELWCQICRAGALSEVTVGHTVVAGDVGKAAPAIGADFISTEIMYDFVALPGPGVLLNLLDDLARTRVAIDHVCIQ